MFARIWKGKKINHAIQVEFSANDNNFKSKQAFDITTSCNTLFIIFKQLSISMTG